MTSKSMIEMPRHISAAEMKLVSAQTSCGCKHTCHKIHKIPGALKMGTIQISTKEEASGAWLILVRDRMVCTHK